MYAKRASPRTVRVHARQGAEGEGVQSDAERRGARERGAHPRRRCVFSRHILLHILTSRHAATGLPFGGIGPSGCTCSSSMLLVARADADGGQRDT